jgi:hypothetical protein
VNEHVRTVQGCRPRTATVEEGPKREKWWDGCGALVSLDLSYERTKLTKVNRDHRQTESVMNDVEDVWWCRTPKNSVVYIRGQRRIALQLGQLRTSWPLGQLAVQPNYSGILADVGRTSSANPNFISSQVLI